MLPFQAAKPMSSPRLPAPSLDGDNNAACGICSANQQRILAATNHPTARPTDPRWSVAPVAADRYAALCRGTSRRPPSRIRWRKLFSGPPPVSPQSRCLGEPNIELSLGRFSRRSVAAAVTASTRPACAGGGRGVAAAARSSQPVR